MVGLFRVEPPLFCESTTVMVLIWERLVVSLLPYLSVFVSDTVPSNTVFYIVTTVVS